MKRLFITVSALSFLMIIAAPLTSAKPPIANGVAPRAQSDQDKAENDAYKAWYDVQKNIPQALPLAKAYLEKFPNGTNAKYLKGWIVSARASLFNDAYKQKNIDEMIKIGNEALAEDPGNLDYVYLIYSTINQTELHAAKPNLAHADQEIEFINKAVKLIQDGKAPSWIPKEKWDKTATLSYLYYDLGFIADNRKDLDKGLDYYKQSYTFDPKNAYSYFAAGTIYQARYVAALQKYQAIPDADKNPPDATTPVKPEVKAALDEVNKEADAVIDVWAHFLAATATNNTFGAVRDRVQQSVEGLYKYRHDNSLDGLQKLIDAYRAGAPAGATAAQPASSTAASASTKPPSGATNL
ncbi:MAG: tetratricopeptide repeat protein [Blastocatellia bacterium]